MKDTSVLVIESDRAYHRDIWIFHTAGMEDGKIYEAIYEMTGIEYYSIKNDPNKSTIIREKVLSNLREVPKEEMDERKESYKQMITEAIESSSFSDKE